jgi:hypothetical protein
MVLALAVAPVDRGGASPCECSDFGACVAVLCNPPDSFESWANLRFSFPLTDAPSTTTQGGSDAAAAAAATVAAVAAVEAVQTCARGDLFLLARFAPATTRVTRAPLFALVSLRSATSPSSRVPEGSAAAMHAAMTECLNHAAPRG